MCICLCTQEEAFPPCLLWMHCFSFHIAVGSCVGCSTCSFFTLPSDRWYTDFSASPGRKISKIYLDAETEAKWLVPGLSQFCPCPGTDVLSSACFSIVEQSLNYWAGPDLLFQYRLALKLLLNCFERSGKILKVPRFGLKWSISWLQILSNRTSEQGNEKTNGVQQEFWVRRPPLWIAKRLHIFTVQLAAARNESMVKQDVSLYTFRKYADNPGDMMNLWCKSKPSIGFFHIAACLSFQMSNNFF